MKHSGFFGRVVLVVSAAVALAVPSVSHALDAGAPAPGFALPLQDGKVYRLDAARGKVVYVDFWASWCGPCRRSFPWLNAMQAKYGAQGFEVVGVNLDQARADAEQFLAQTPARFRIAFDPAGTSAKEYAVKGMPSSVLVGADGRVVLTHAGFREDERAELEAKIVAALKAAAR